MKRRTLAALALCAALALFTPNVSADHGNGQGKGKGNPHAAARSDRDDDGWERHDRYDVRIYGPRDGRPPGWSKGNKTGWGDCGMPPGQAKKYGCRTYVFQNRRYYYYQDEIGRIVVRRPRIEIHTVIE
jgi:hypothetical protein